MKQRKQGLTMLALSGMALAAFGVTAPVSEAAVGSVVSGKVDAAASVPPVGSAAYGWTAAIRHQSGPQDNQGTLVLVPPTGGIRTIGPVSDGARVHDVSGDARRVLTAFEKDGQTRVTVWDTSTKKPTYFRVVGTADVQLGGDGILVGGYGRSVESRTLAGRLVRTVSTAKESFRAAPGGTVFYQTVGSTITGRDAKTGAVRSTWKAPAPYNTTTGFCQVRQQWGPGEMAVDCADELSAGQTYRVSVTSGVMAPLTPQIGAKAYPTTSKRVLQDLFGDAPTVGYLAGGRKVDLPGLPNGNPYTGASSTMLGGRGSTAYLDQVDWSRSQHRQTLVRYDLAKDTYVRLAGSGTATGGLITQAQTIDGYQ